MVAKHIVEHAVRLLNVHKDERARKLLSDALKIEDLKEELRLLQGQIKASERALDEEIGYKGEYE